VSKNFKKIPSGSEFFFSPEIGLYGYKKNPEFYADLRSE
jgi:hypothetical protein